MSGCHCGCRAHGFSHDTLSNRGLYGVLVPSPGAELDSDSTIRHPPPTEIAIPNGVPELVWPDDLRLAIAGLGQMAAPFQSVRVGAQLQRHIDEVFHGDSPIDSLALMDQLKAKMFQLIEALDFLPIPPVDLPETPCFGFARFAH